MAKLKLQKENVLKKGRANKKTEGNFERKVMLCWLKNFFWCFLVL